MTAVLSDLIAALPAHLVQPTSNILVATMVFLMIASLLASLVGKRAWQAAKGQLVADVIRALFRSFFRHPLHWGLAGAVLWATGMSAAEARSVSAVQRAAAKAARHGPATAGIAPPKVHVTALCGPSRPCPLLEHVGATFLGGRYRETVLRKDTSFHRVQAGPDVPLGDPASPWTYWSRARETGIQAIINRAIPSWKNGNTAGHSVTITLPRGTRVYEGTIGPHPRGPVGGGNQVIIHRADLARAQQPGSQSSRRTP